jgi:hypothetical protein
LKYILIIIIFLSSLKLAKAQAICGGPWPKNLRPDTVTTFLFLSINKSISIDKITNTKPTSNYGFKAKNLNIEWWPIEDSFVKEFIEGSFQKMKTIDTLNCIIFGKDHSVIVLKSNFKIRPIIYQDNFIDQEIFYVEIKNKRKLFEVLEFLTTNLNQSSLNNPFFVN